MVRLRKEDQAGTGSHSARSAVKVETLKDKQDIADVPGGGEAAPS